MCVIKDTSFVPCEICAVVVVYLIFHIIDKRMLVLPPVAPRVA